MALSSPSNRYQLGWLSLLFALGGCGQQERPEESRLYQYKEPACGNVDPEPRRAPGFSSAQTGTDSDPLDAGTNDNDAGPDNCGDASQGLCSRSQESPDGGQLVTRFPTPTDLDVESKSVQCGVFQDLLSAYTASDYCNKIDACDLEFKTCRELIWRSTELREVLGGVPTENALECLYATYRLDECVFALSCPEFECYSEPNSSDGDAGSNACAAPSPCAEQDEDYVSACALLNQLLAANLFVRGSERRPEH